MLRLLLIAAVLAAGWIAPASAQDMTARCKAMAGLNAAAEARLVTLKDGPTKIIAASVVAAAGDLPEYCKVEGVVAPNIGFELRLPTTAWNGKFLHSGCGGYCGFIGFDRAHPALARGYAVVASDMGHRGQTWLFAYNNIQGEIDFGFRATHVVTVAAKEIIDVFYGKRAARNYYSGCSTGGRQGMVEAQRFPYDFDGLIAGAPVSDETGDGMLFVVWNPLANLDKNGKPIMSPKKLPMIHAAVMAKCDALDGLKDNLLQDPRKCDWKPSEIACRSDRGGDDCLTRAEIGVVEKIYSGATNSKGEPWYFGMQRGSEYTWTPEFIGPEGRPGQWLDGPSSFGEEFATTLPFFYDPAIGTKAGTYDWDRDPPRRGLTEHLYNAQNPDLRTLKKAGAKLILYHGWDDDQIPPGLSVDYYETATRTMGGPEATMDFFRFFTVPGMLHCAGGPGGGEIDFLTAIENWVEKGQAPEQVIVHRLVDDKPGPRPVHPLKAGQFDRSRPVYPYPAQARYKGTGDPDVAANWERAP
ncbi:MAG: tannase/feruloyl esterase family alpha/beta hydrolase [Alphaproteobacteria bacterium]|nr:tannase/feruloyl esterase family alpha/beta hydrolase [Alphaproteobacteria bacterium]